MKRIVRNIRELSRLISKIENFELFRNDTIKYLLNSDGFSHVIGFTGPPGAGKSTVCDKVGKILLEENKKVGILAVDPTSPFTGGAILGDRIRMSEAIKKGAFVRSIGSRGGIGGISKRTYLSVLSLENFGMDYVLVETVGVGQSDFEVRYIADTVCVILTPESGDYIQAMKAGLMEIGDIYVINKGDRPGAEDARKEIKAILDLIPSHSDWDVPVIKITAIREEGIDKLVDYIKKHGEFIKNRKEKIVKKRKERFIKEYIKDEILFDIDSFFEKEIRLEDVLSHLNGRDLDRLKKRFVNFLSKKTGSNPF